MNIAKATLCVFLTLVCAVAAIASSPPNPFTSTLSIHGRLAPLDKGVPTPNGMHDINYQVLDGNGIVLASASSTNVDVLSGGTFFDAPDFGSEVFAGSGERFLQVSIRPSGTSDPFVDFQPIEVKPHPRAQVAGEIFLPQSRTVTTGTGTAALNIANNGQGGTASFSNTNPTRTDSVVNITAPAGPSAPDALTVTGGTTMAGKFKAGPDPLFAIFIVDEFGVLVDSSLMVNGKATFNDGVNVNGPTNFNDTVEMTSGKTIGQALGTAVISNSSPTGRGLLAFNQAGGEGMFGSSINGTGVVCEGTGASSVGCFAFSNTGRPVVAQTNATNSTQPTITANQAGLAPGMFVQQSNPNAAASGVPAVQINAATGANSTGLLVNGKAKFAQNVALGSSTLNPTNPLQHTSGANLSLGGVWINASSRQLKENFHMVDPRDVLNTLADLPIARWNYRVDNASVKHIGPTAEDFADAFGLGENNRTIGTVDADGVALAAIQGLHQIVRERDAEIADLKARLARLEARMNGL